MKNFMKSIGKAAAYFGVYFLVQMMISFVYGVVWTVNKIATLTAAGEEINDLLLTEQLSAQITEDAMVMSLWGGIITLLIYWIRFAVRKKKFLKEIELNPISLNGVLPIIVVAVGLTVIIVVVISYIPWPKEWIEAYTTGSASLDGSLMSWISAVLVAPVVEEILFRGLIYTRLKKGMPMVVAAVLTSLLFGLMHGTIIWILYAFVLGMIMTWIFERYQSLVANIIFHLSFNAMGMLLPMIPERAEFIIWILFVASIVGCVLMFKQIIKVTGREEVLDENQ